MWTTVAWVVGLGFQLFGVAIAFVGAIFTYRKYKRPGQPAFFDWALRPVRRASSAIWRWIRAVVLRRSPQPHLRLGSATASGAGLFSAEVQVTHSPLDPALSLEDRVSILDDRSRRDKETLNRVQSDLLDERRRLDNLSTAFEEKVGEARAESSESLRTYATGGLKASAFGLFLTALGMVISALPAAPWMPH